jgi:hypothetical protein
MTMTEQGNVAIVAATLKEIFPSMKEPEAGQQ